VEAGDRPWLGAAAAGALAGAGGGIAERTRSGAPVADVGHDGLVDAGPEAAPQRGREVVAGRGQVLACLRDQPAPGGEQRVDLLIRWRHPDLAQRCPGLAIELIDRLLDQDTGRAADRALVAGDHELVEARQRAGLARPGRHAEPHPPLLGQERVRVRTGGLPQRSRQRASELDDDRPRRADVPVGQSRGGHRQCVLVDELLLEVGDRLRTYQCRISSAATRQRHQAHQSPTSSEAIMRRHYNETVTQGDGSSIRRQMGVEPALPARTQNRAHRRPIEPEFLEIAG